MKKVFVLLLMVFLSFGLTVGATETEPTTTEPVTETTALEDTTETTDELPEAGLTPEDAFYGFDKFFENIALRLTFSDEKRAEKLSNIAEERLAELNALDPEKATLYADELFNEYGLSLEKANLYVQKLVSEGKISEERLAKLEAKVAKAEERQARIKDRVKEKISTEVKDSVDQAIKNAKMSIFSKFEDQEAMNTLHEEGYGYGQLLKLQAIAKLSSKTIDELLALENVVTTNEENEKVINFELLVETLGLTTDDVKNTLTDYRTEAKEAMQSKMDEAKNQATQRREEVKERVNGKVNK